MKRLEAQVAPAVPSPFEEDDFTKHPELVKGYIGPQVLGKESPAGIEYLVDRGSCLAPHGSPARTNPAVTSLIWCGRDFTFDGTIEAAEVRDGDPAPDGSGPCTARVASRSGTSSSSGASTLRHST